MQRQRPSTSWRNHTSKVRLNPYKKPEVLFLCAFLQWYCHFLSITSSNEKYLNLIFHRFIRGMGPNPVLMGESSIILWSIQFYTNQRRRDQTSYSSKTHPACGFQFMLTILVVSPKQKQLPSSKRTALESNKKNSLQMLPNLSMRFFFSFCMINAKHSCHPPR